MSDTVEILIKCPRQDQIEIEEICINRGVNFSKYFLDLHHHNTQLNFELMKENKEKSADIEGEKEFEKINSKKCSKKQTHHIPLMASESTE